MFQKKKKKKRVEQRVRNDARMEDLRLVMRMATGFFIALLSTAKLVSVIVVRETILPCGCAPHAGKSDKKLELCLEEI